jgi:IS5 family transposase
MSMQPQGWPQPAPEVAAAIRAIYRGKREAPLPVQVRDRLGELFADTAFAQAFGARGKPGWSPGRLALTTVLQMTENLTDRQAAEAARCDLTWKYALGLALDDPGFDHTVLCEFRARVAAHHLEEQVLDLLLARLVEVGLLAGGGKQRTDSTYVISAVRDLNRTELAGEAVRACLEALASAAPHWLAAVVDVSSWTRRYGARIDTWRLPKTTTKRAQLATEYGRDGFALVQAVYDPASPAWLRELPAVQVLRMVLLQNYTRTVTRGREVVKRREADTEGLPPGHIRLISPYDTDARWGVKGDFFWGGYKIHVSETCTDAPEDDRGRPNLITDVTTTNATVPDVKAIEGIHARLEGRTLLPAEHCVDSGYASAELIVGALPRYGVALITPVLADTSRQARTREGFDAAAFAIDWARQQVICPQGQVSSTWTPCTQRGRPMTVVTFAKTTCGPCPVRMACTRSKRGARQLSLHPRALVESLRSQRAEQQTKDWKTEYALRSGVEGTISQAVARTGTRRARYRGLVKTHLEHVFSAVALNLIRLDAWWNGRPLDRTRTSHLARLDLSLAA